MPEFYDFFAGAGLATLALQHAWRCVWANDIDPRKASVYVANFGPDHFHTGDVAGCRADDLPAGAHLAWASFPCQDLSLAGVRRGLSGSRSGTFWAFWRIMSEQADLGSRPPLIVLENVTGLLHGDGFQTICEALAALGMQFGALVLDARHFVPQSRPRVFFVAADVGLDCSRFTLPAPAPAWTPKSLANAHARLEPAVRKLWRWWMLPEPCQPPSSLHDILETDTGQWHSSEQTQRLLSLMSPAHRTRISDRLQSATPHTGLLYKRTRNGVQRAEVRFDGLSGCLRTPSGGSSRQTVVVIDRGAVRTRLLTAREAARLMGVPDTFALPDNYNHAYHAMGDAVAVPVVRHLSQHLLQPLLTTDSRRSFRRSAHP